MLSFVLIGVAFAADEYSFELRYTGTITKDVEKNAEVLLVGVNGALHSNVRINVKVTGPATPKLLAKDTNGVEHDIAQVGYWGPEAGFPVQGNFENVTPIRATFPKEGKYTIELSLVDVANANSVITSKTFDIEVHNEQAPVNNTVNNTVVEELPKTGTSITEYILYAAIFGVAFAGVAIYTKRRAHCE